MIPYIVGRLGDIGVGWDRHDEAGEVLSGNRRLQWMELKCVGEEVEREIWGGGMLEGEVEIRQASSVAAPKRGRGQIAVWSSNAQTTASDWFVVGCSQLPAPLPPTFLAAWVCSSLEQPKGPLTVPPEVKLPRYESPMEPEPNNRSADVGSWMVHVGFVHLLLARPEVAWKRSR